jgi:hypothetical protein
MGLFGENRWRNFSLWPSFVCFCRVGASAQSSRFSKYKTVEAYEIGPGILMMPNFSSDGQVCEIGLEILHYSPKEFDWVLFPNSH